MFVPIILGSDKTTVSVATGQNDFYPLYLSIGNVQNHIRRTHKNALVLIGFLPIPKGSCHSFTHIPAPNLTGTTGARKDTDTEEFRTFKRDLTHRSIATILFPLRPFMKTPDIILCPDGYFRRAIYGLGPHISDYPEQMALTWLLLGWCPTCVILLTGVYCSLLKSLQAAFPTRLPSTPHAVTGPRFTLMYYLECMMKKPYESHTALRLVLRYVSNVV